MLDNDPLWYKDAIIYELHVRAFHDSTGSGTGDFKGLTQKLDYLQDLGITTIWLLPFYPSPLRDDGYDIADYSDIHPLYGKLADFQEFLNAAHERGLRVITELVINHTSDQHPWFQRARKAPPGSVERDFYVWSDTPTKYAEARIIFKDFEVSNWAWDPVAKSNYWHRFYSHQPDLNYDNPAVWNAIFPVCDFWLAMGVDGMRLDAVPYLYERENSNCENLPETHGFLKAMRKHVDDKFANRMLLAEANQWPEDSVAYFGQGDECHMAFHFPVMPRLFMAIHMEDRFPILDIMAQTPRIPDNCQWGMFLRNHDELTLEMVTDEERDYMYRAYAADPRARINLGIRHRLAPLLGNDRRRIELMNGLLFSLPGTPVLYYGDEIGMGDNIYLGDRNGVRTPMQWTADRNAGFSRANPQRLYLPVIIDPEYHYEAVNVEAQQNNPNSLLWWMKRLIALRKRYKAFGRGTLEFLLPSNRKMLAFLRRYQDETILVVANLSRFVQQTELDLSAFEGMVPVEMFGQTPFPRLGKQPYTITLAGHAFYWIALTPAPVRDTTGHARSTWQVPTVRVGGGWQDVLRKHAPERLEPLLPAYLRRQPWYTGGHRAITGLTIRDQIPFRYGDAQAFVLILLVEYNDGPRDTFVLPIAFASTESAGRLQDGHTHAVIVRVEGKQDGVVFDALHDARFCEALIEAVRTGRLFPLTGGDIVTAAFAPDRLVLGADNPLPAPLHRETENRTSVVFPDRLIFKSFRVVEEGINPDLEVRRHLSVVAPTFRQVPAILGAVEYRPRLAEAVTLAVVHEYIANEGTAWQVTLDELSRFIERVLVLPASEQPPGRTGPLLDLAFQEVPPRVQEQVGRYLEFARLLGQRTGELHLALATPTDAPAFAPEGFSTLYRRSLYQSMRNLSRRCFERLREAVADLPEAIRGEAGRLLAYEDDLLHRFGMIVGFKTRARRIRIHGHLSLPQVLYTGKDFVFINFEGDPVRSINERRAKRCPLRDVISMLRSFYTVAASALLDDGNAPGFVRAEDRAALAPWVKTWFSAVAAVYLKAYLSVTADADFYPSAFDELKLLFELFYLEELVAELDHAIRFDSGPVSVPLESLLDQLVPPA